MRTTYFWLCLCLLASTTLFTSCTDDDDDDIIVVDTPVTIKQFMLNFTEADPQGSTWTLNKNEPLQIGFIFEDEGEMRDYEFYMLINDQTDLRHNLTSQDLQTTNMSFGYTWDRLTNFRLADLTPNDTTDDTYYQTIAGDQLHFYATVEDDLGNVSNIDFIITLTE